jgi:hypothetical protein
MPGIPVTAATQITRVCSVTAATSVFARAALIGGSRATAVTSDRHGARLAFEIVDEPACRL